MLATAIFVLILVAGTAGTTVSELSLNNLIGRLTQFAAGKGLDRQKLDDAIKQVIEVYKTKILRERLMALLH